MLRDLLQPTARVPWDDRPAIGTRGQDPRLANVLEYFRDVGSALIENADSDRIYRRMRLTLRDNDHEVPRNVFAEFAHEWAPSAWIDVPCFPRGGAGDVIDERHCLGGMADQIRDCLRCIQGLIVPRTVEQPDRPPARSSTSHPMRAVRESLVNATYHDGCAANIREPTNVYLGPDRLGITSYPGSVHDIEAEHFSPNSSVPTVSARHRRIGGFLKELRMAEGRLQVFRRCSQPYFPTDRPNLYSPSTRAAATSASRCPPTVVMSRSETRDSPCSPPIGGESQMVPRAEGFTLEKLTGVTACRSCQTLD